MTDEAYRESPKTIISMFTGKKVDIEAAMSEGGATSYITGIFEGAIQEMGFWWIILKDASYFTHSGTSWEIPGRIGPNTTKVNTSKAFIRIDKVAFIGFARGG